MVALRIDDDVALGDLRRRGGPDLDDAALAHDDGISGHDRLAPVAGQDRAKVDDGCLHEMAAVSVNRTEMLASSAARRRGRRGSCRPAVFDRTGVDVASGAVRCELPRLPRSIFEAILVDCALVSTMAACAFRWL